jgi:ribonuclease-3
MPGHERLPALPYEFRDPRLLRVALTHRSYGAEHNERLEFVGDGVLNCVIAHELYRRFPQLPEGDLSRVRANLVNQPTLHEIAAGRGLGEHLRFGEGELRSGGARRPSILADALEAVIGAVFVDGGYAAAERVVGELYAGVLEGMAPERLGKDPKTRLQEWLQGRRMPVPDYAVVAVTGEAHAQTFEVACRIPALGLELFARGPSRRAAEQKAAALALAQVTRG